MMLPISGQSVLWPTGPHRVCPVLPHKGELFSDTQAVTGCSAIQDGHHACTHWGRSCERVTHHLHQQPCSMIASTRPASMAVLLELQIDPAINLLLSANDDANEATCNTVAQPVK